MLVVDESAAVRGAIRDFIQATTPYMVYDTVENGVSAIQKATESRCDLILLHTRVPEADSVEMASLLRSKLPHTKIVGFSSVDLENREPPATGFDAVISKQDGPSKLVETLRALTRTTTRVTVGALRPALREEPTRSNSMLLPLRR